MGERSFGNARIHVCRPGDVCEMRQKARHDLCDILEMVSGLVCLRKDNKGIAVYQDGSGDKGIK